MSHLRNHEVLLYLKGEQSAEARNRLLDHIRSCDTCRDRVEQEQGLDQLLRHRLVYHKAPAHLMDRLRGGLDRAARQARVRRRPAGWVSTGAGAVAATVALLLVLVPSRPGELFHEGLVAAGPRSGAFRNLRGLLVCAGCAHASLDIELHKRCTRGEADGHVTGLLEADGQIWRFMQTEEVAELMTDPVLRGRPVEVSARPFANIDYLRVYDVHDL